MVLNERRGQEIMDSTNLPRNKILCGDCMVGLKELPECVQSGRDYIGWELDEGYHKTAERRVDSAHKSTNLLSFIE
jgi:hypothetical protein